MEAARSELESQYERSEEYAKQVASDYRDAASQDSPDAKKLAELKQKLEAAVNASFKNQSLLQKTRLKIADLDLIDLRASYERRESLSKTIIERRIADLISDQDKGWSSSTKANPAGDLNSQNPVHESQEASAAPLVPRFDTPEELIDFLETTIRENKGTKSLKTLVDLLDQEELHRAAGAALRAASMFRAISNAVKGFSAFGPEGANQQLIQVGNGLDELIKDARLKKPSRKAQAAFEAISFSDLSVLRQILRFGANQSPPPIIDPELYSAKLRAAAGVLKDPRQFLVHSIELIEELSEDQGDQLKLRAPSRKPVDWQITVDGDKALAIAPFETAHGVGLGHSVNRLELKKAGDTWKISNFISDEMITELQQGLVFNTSSDNEKSDTPQEPRTPSQDPSEK